MKLHLTFHTLFLEIYRESNFPRRIQSSLPCVEIDKGQEYKAKDILDSRIRGGQVEYLIHWLEYPFSEHTWEPTSNLINTPLKIQEFHRQQLRKPKATINFN